MLHIIHINKNSYIQQYIIYIKMGFKRENTLAAVFTALQICVIVPQTQHRLRQLFHKALKLASSQQCKAAQTKISGL